MMLAETIAEELSVSGQLLEDDAVWPSRELQAAPPPFSSLFCCLSVPIAGSYGSSDGEVVGGGVRLWWLLVADAQRLWPAKGRSRR